MLALIVGASGFIGNRVYWHLKEKGVNLRGSYRTDAHNILEGEKVYINLSEGNFEKVLSLHGLTHIILCHGVSNIEQCKRDIYLPYLINVTNTIKLLECFKKADVIPVYFSTSMVYDGVKSNPSELDSPRPINEYGRQKLMVEEYLKSTFRKYIILRLTKVFDVGRRDKTLFTSWLDKLISNEKIQVPDDVFIAPVFISDVIRIVEILIKGNHYGIYNLGGREVGSVFDFARRLTEYFKFDLALIRGMPILDFKFVEARPKFNSVDSVKVEKDTGVKLTPYEECFNRIANNYGIAN